jgi:hypothetical protein
MAAKTDMHTRIKTIILLVFACFLGAALWQGQTLSTLADNKPASADQPASQPAALAEQGVPENRVAGYTARGLSEVSQQYRADA